MFTGIIEEQGTVKNIIYKINLSVLKLKAKKILKGLNKGDSIAVNGVCLTLMQQKNEMLFFDLMKETFEKTTLGFLKPGDCVNLERALNARSRFSGHFMTGHIDDIGMIKERIDKPNYTEFKITLRNKKLNRFIVPKGSICIDGVSLTIGRVNKNFFSVYLIPFTKKMTTLGVRKRKDQVNIETDILAKYILKH